VSPPLLSGRGPAPRGGAPRCLCADRSASFGVSVAGLRCRCHACGEGCCSCGEWQVGPPDSDLPGTCFGCSAGVGTGNEKGVVMKDRAGVVPVKRQVRRSCRPGPADSPVERTVVRPAGRDLVLFDRAGEVWVGVPLRVFADGGKVEEKRDG